ncbi:flavodoxin domain-containing protein [bacterium]|nr:flavodoxin domain-containing protein [bacterium]
MKVIIVFGSFVGNTETVAGYVQRGLEQAGHEVTCKDAVYSDIEELEDYELILLGSPTYEPKMVQDDLLDFFEALADVDLSHKKAQAFGPGDTAWPDFCVAVDMLEERLRECGAEMIGEKFTIDGVVEDFEQETINWAKTLTLDSKAPGLEEQTQQ